MKNWFQRDIQSISDFSQLLKDYDYPGLAKGRGKTGFSIH